MEEYMFETGLTAYTEGVNEPGIIKLEHSLLELAGCPDLLNGLFYMLPLYTNGHLYIRYIYINLINKWNTDQKLYIVYLNIKFTFQI